MSLHLRWSRRLSDLIHTDNREPSPLATVSRRSLDFSERTGPSKRLAIDEDFAALLDELRRVLCVQRLFLS